jgi:hypothetical protein
MINIPGKNLINYITLVEVNEEDMLFLKWIKT